MKHLSFLFVFLSAVFSAQKLQVVDSENGKPIANARIVLSNQLVYTNEDGFAPVEESATNFEVSASGFQKQTFEKYISLIKLQPEYKDIEEVKIVNVDIKKIFEDVFKNYHKRYYEDPSVYNVLVKQKSFDNGKLHFMVIAEAKLWSKNNSYNWKDGFKKNNNEILQMQLNNVKYFKNNKSDSIFSARTNEFSHETFGNYFFNFELNRILSHVRNKNTKYSGTLISDDGEEQLISIKIKSGFATSLKGEFRFNKKDKVITYYEITYLQNDFPTLKKIATDGREFNRKLGDATVKFEFYKKDEFYIPTIYSLNTDHFIDFYKDETHEKKSSAEIIYNTFSKSDKKGLDPKIDFNKSIWENVPVKDDKGISVLLSKEEQEFINQK